MVTTSAALRQADAIVVLGNHPPTDAKGNVQPETRRRVEAGVQAFQLGAAPLMVMSGGKTGMYVEAEVMRALALELGVPGDAVIMEAQSHSTIANARYSTALLRERLQRKAISVIVVSSPHHLARARALFECAGAEVQVFGTAVPDSFLYRLGFTLYELYQRFAYLFIDECARARGEPDRKSYRGIL